MRSEDLSGIPESIERWKVGELLEGLGFKPGSYVNVAEIVIGARGATIKAYATDDNGRRYLVEDELVPVQDLGDKEPTYVRGSGTYAAMHEISIPFVGSWEKAGRCDSRHRSGIRCHHDAGHEGLHQLGSVSWDKPWPVGPDGKLLPPAASGTTNG